MKPKLLKCRFCNYTILAWRTKGGQHRSGWDLLHNHVATKHPEEYMKVQQALDEEDEIRNIRR